MKKFCDLRRTRIRKLLFIYLGHATCQTIEINPLLCPNYGGEIKIIVLVTEMKLIKHQAIAPARDPPIFYAEIDQTQYWDANGVNPTAEYEFDQTESG